MYKTGFIAIAAAAGVLMIGGAGSAATQQSTNVHGWPQRLVPAGEHKVLAIFTDAGNPQSELAAGDNTIETATVTCPTKAVSCTLVLNAMDQVAFPASNTQWAISVLVDGVDVDGGPVQDLLPANGIDLGNWTGEYAVSPGQHTITFRTYVEIPALQAAWTVNYAITKP